MPGSSKGQQVQVPPARPENRGNPRVFRDFCVCENCYRCLKASRCRRLASAAAIASTSSPRGRATTVPRGRSSCCGPRSGWRCGTRCPRATRWIMAPDCDGPSRRRALTPKEGKEARGNRVMGGRTLVCGAEAGRVARCDAGGLARHVRAVRRSVRDPATRHRRHQRNPLVPVTGTIVKARTRTATCQSLPGLCASDSG